MQGRLVLRGCRLGVRGRGEPHLQVDLAVVAPVVDKVETLTPVNSSSMDSLLCSMA